MNKTLTNEERQNIANDVKQFLAEEFEVDVSEIQDQTNMADDLGADSILFLELIEEFKQKYDFGLEVRTIGQYMLKKRISTVGETIEAIYEIVEKGEELVAELEEEAGETTAVGSG